MTTGSRTLTSARAAVLAELCWTAGDRTSWTAVTPLVLDGELTVALTYDRLELARELAAADAVAVTLTDPRLAGPGFDPRYAIGRASVEPDPDGDRFVTRLLDQELAKHPPSRELADSRMLRREHWWFLPRMLVTLGVIHEGELESRAPRDWVGAASLDGDLRLATVPDPIDAGDELPRTAPLSDVDTVALFRHDRSLPEMDRGVEQRATATRTAAGLTVASIDGPGELPRPLGLLARMRAVRDLRRGCIRGLEQQRYRA